MVEVCQGERERECGDFIVDALNIVRSEEVIVWHVRLS
jgi:hypothetical protein